jgi:two-component system LytT family sensor kinase
MLFCNKHFEKEFLKVEKWSQYIGIPLFTIFSILFLTPYPFILEKQHFLFHMVFSFVGVVAIWYSIRFIIFFFRKYCNKLNFGLRLTLQLLVSSITTIFIIWGLDYFGTTYIINKLEFCGDYDDFNTKNLYLITIIFTFLINTIYESFYLFLRLTETALEKERYKNESLEAQYQNLTSRLNPHFLFNSLNTLTTVVEEDPKKAVNYIRELSVVYRYVLNSQKLTWADLTAELKFTQSYILLLKMRFEDNLKITLDICEQFINYHILAMTVQLLIENAVKHNEISNSHPLEIKIFCEDEKLVVTNKKQKRNIMPSTTKVGLHNITERYRFLVNKEVIIEDKSDTFTVSIPLVKTIDEDREHIEEYQ